MTEDQKQIVLRAIDEPDNLSAWEFDFINSLAEMEHVTLTKKQDDILVRIAHKLGEE
jgi:hypothetical protein